MNTTSKVQEQVKEKYGSAARAVAESSSVQGCCDPGLRCCDPITTNLYSADEKGIIPEKAVRASLGCGNPTALIGDTLAMSTMPFCDSVTNRFTSRMADRTAS